MKTKEELNALKEEVATLNAKLAELTNEELAQVAGGVKWPEGTDDIENAHDSQDYSAGRNPLFH